MEIPDEKIAMITIIMSLKNFIDPVAMQSISDAALQHKKELEPKLKDDDKAVKFLCSDCGHTRIEAVMDGPHTTIIEGMDDSGGVEYGDTESEGYLDRFQCVGCGNTIKDKFDEPIKDDEELVEWCKENCNQE